MVSFQRKQLLGMYLPLAQQVREKHGDQYVGDYMELSFLGGMADILSLRIEKLDTIEERDRVIGEFREDMLEGWEVLVKRLLLEGTVVDKELISAAPEEPQQFLEAMRRSQGAVDELLEKIKGSGSIKKP